jgi:hypothetical protein
MAERPAGQLVTPREVTGPAGVERRQLERCGRRKHRRPRGGRPARCGRQGAMIPNRTDQITLLHDAVALVSALGDHGFSLPKIQIGEAITALAGATARLAAALPKQSA